MLVAAKDRGQFTATTAMFVVDIALLKNVLESGPEGHRWALDPLYHILLILKEYCKLHKPLGVCIIYGWLDIHSSLGESGDIYVFGQYEWFQIVWRETILPIEIYIQIFIHEVIKENSCD